MRISSVTFKAVGIALLATSFSPRSAVARRSLGMYARRVERLAWYLEERRFQ